MAIKTDNKDVLNQSNKSPKELAILFQVKLKELKKKYNYLARR